ncbi:MAG TPA: GNAT family N-acetyltransferase [Bryobacteraceae bacterium]|nr:GNAT family N-acetyltransferase [Bryobacteraceae bacterium]
MKAPEIIKTERLILRKPLNDDAEAIFSRYSSDLEVTKYLGWPRHRIIEDTKSFLAFSDAEWERWPAGPYLIESLVEQRLLGSTGLAFESPSVAATGYVLARDAWGFGYATEALNAVVALARDLGVNRLYALCHPANVASVHVLGKCGFHNEGFTPSQHRFPNLDPDDPGECLCFARHFEPAART